MGTVTMGAVTSTKTLLCAGRAAGQDLAADLVRFESVGKVHGTARAGRAALTDISFRMPRGACVVVTGDAGSGKSTLLRLAAGLAAPTTGTVTFAGTAVREPGAATGEPLRRGRIGFLSAQPRLVPGCSVLENITLPLGGSANLDRAQRGRVDALIDQLGLSRVKYRMPTELSERLRRRVALARVLVTDPELVIADEPTDGDPVTLVSLVRWLSVSGRSVLLATRDARPVARCADHLLRLSAGAPAPVRFTE